MSPRATPTEEPDGGNLLVRIWRGAGVGNLPAYSTCDQAMLVEGDWRWRCLHETLCAVQRVRNPPGQG
jgi:hypothetical protein